MVLAVVTDSTADLEPALAARLGISVVPLRVQFGEQSYRDRIDLSTEDFYARLAQAESLPVTSQPSVGDFLEVYRPLAAADRPILSLHLAASFSGTWNSARTAAAALLEEVPGAEVSVLDSGTVTLGLGLMVVTVARLAARGADLAGAALVAEALAPRVRILALLDTLRYLEKGGRIGAARALLGTLLAVKPIIAVVGGEVVAAGRVRSRASGIERLVEMAAADGPFEQMAVLHGGAEAEAAALADLVRERFHLAEVLVGEISPVIGTHAGPRAIGLVYVRAAG